MPGLFFLRINVSTTTLVSKVIYHRFGPAKQIVYNNGLVQARSYDSGYRIENLTLVEIGAASRFRSY